MRIDRSLTAFLLLFTVSGFAGLIYQSIWSQYLRLMLGHAAYAQTLVLVIFMGGMAIGSGIVASNVHRLRNPLGIYAAVELIIGLIALVFHPAFIGIQHFLHEAVYPGIPSPDIAAIVKWLVAGFILLPQSILIGMTFPLMSGAITRVYPKSIGSVVSSLYFSNSLGAAIGVLISGFFLIGAVGLPGTLLTAGLVNVALALLLWKMSKTVGIVDGIGTLKDANDGEMKRDIDGTNWQIGFPTKFALAVALITGATSFIYEIAWMRMLSLILGGSTHSFELMLSAMILGIAVGSAWIRRNIDSYLALLIVLAIAIALKGVMAIATLPVYVQTFELVQHLQLALNKTEFGYSLLNVASHAISMLVMFPAAFFSGMSLPILTTYLFQNGHGERAIGEVYAWNTLGAIVGVFLAVHLGLTMLGMKNLILVAAAIDICVAAWIVTHRSVTIKRHLATVAALSIVAVFVGMIFFVEFDTLKLASGVYRDGRFFAADANKVIYYRDGKTATISVIDHASDLRSIATNGKTDASLQMKSTPSIGSDESTMILAGTLPLAFRPNAQNVANIGFGSGQTTHTLLGHPNLVVVDNIEIEPMMVEGARLFGPLVERAFTDPRSKIHYDDAKSFFASQRTKYDVIISEPSNPWVSGVASLFSDEFYDHAKQALSKDGVLVQWVQLYETDLTIVASIMRAVNKNFSDYTIFDVNGSEMLVVATNADKPLKMSGEIFSHPAIAEQLKRIGINGLSDLESWRMGDKRVFAALFESIGAPINSDYFPFVDQNAARARFLSAKSMVFADVLTARAPVVDILEGRNNIHPLNTPHGVPYAQDSIRQSERRVAQRVFEYVKNDTRDLGKAELPSWQIKVEYLKSVHSNCVRRENDTTWSNVFFETGAILAKSLLPSDAENIWQLWNKQNCPNTSGDVSSNWIEVFRAVNKRDALQIVSSASELWLRRSKLSQEQRQYLSEVLMASFYRLGRSIDGQKIFEEYVQASGREAKISLAHQLVVANARRYEGK